MKYKFKISVNGGSNVTLEAWSAIEAVKKALIFHLSCTNNPEVGNIDTITVERVS